MNERTQKKSMLKFWRTSIDGKPYRQGYLYTSLSNKLEEKSRKYEKWG